MPSPAGRSYTESEEAFRLRKLFAPEKPGLPESQAYTRYCGRYPWEAARILRLYRLYGESLLGLSYQMTSPSLVSENPGCTGGSEGTIERRLKPLMSDVEQGTPDGDGRT